MGCNSCFHSHYNDATGQWRQRFPGIPIDRTHLNSILVKAWDNYSKDPQRKRITIEAFKQSSLYPLVSLLKGNANETIEDKANREMRVERLTKLSKIFIPKPVNNTQSSKDTAFVDPRDSLAKSAVLGEVGDTMYKLVISKAASDIAQRSTTAPASELQSIMLATKAVKSIRLPNPAAIEGNSRKSAAYLPTGTGHITNEHSLQLLKNYQNEKIERENTAEVNRAALNLKRATTLVTNNDICKSFIDELSQQNPKAVDSFLANQLKPTLVIALKTLAPDLKIGDRKKTDIIQSLQPLLTSYIGSQPSQNDKDIIMDCGRARSLSLIERDNSVILEVYYKGVVPGHNPSKVIQV